MALDLLELAKLEYTKLKDEQIKRIGFRDNLLYVNLVLMSGIFSFVFVEKGYAPWPWKFHGLLVAGWVALILGWTYVVNDEKISAIGRCIRENLLKIIDDQIPTGVFGWEIAHRSDPRRKRRKVEQLVIDELSFVGAGVGAVILFLVFSSHLDFWAGAISATEILMLLGLGWEIFLYADFGIGGASGSRASQIGPA
jgi:hypothetical protein